VPDEVSDFLGIDYIPCNQKIQQIAGHFIALNQE
jgi:hypothetical protein